MLSGLYRKGNGGGLQPAMQTSDLKKKEKNAKRNVLLFCANLFTTVVLEQRWEFF